MSGPRKLVITRIARFIAHLAIYLLIGPFIGATLWGLAAFFWGSSESASSDGSTLGTAFAFILAYVLIFPYVLGVGYMIGGMAAFVAGIIVALLGPLIPYRPIRPVFAGVVGALSSYFLWVPLQHLDQDDRIMAIIGGLSAVICSVLVELAEGHRTGRPAA